jgi:hypothetical protein
MVGLLHMVVSELVRKLSVFAQLLQFRKSKLLTQAVQNRINSMSEGGILTQSSTE